VPGLKCQECARLFIPHTGHELKENVKQRLSSSLWFEIFRTSASDPRRTLRMCWHEWLLATEPIRRRLRNTSRIWCTALHSCHGHIYTQSAKNWPELRLGRSPESEKNQSHQVNSGTIARADCIKRISATHRWADVVDLQMFLKGFDAGERYALRKQGMEMPVLSQGSPENQPSENNTSAMGKIASL
jgi:hypothetical protein